MAEEWIAIPATPSPMALARATLQHSIKSHNERPLPPRARGTRAPRPKSRFTSHPPDKEGRRSASRTSNAKRSPHESLSEAATPTEKTRVSHSC